MRFNRNGSLLVAIGLLAMAAVTACGGETTGTSGAGGETGSGGGPGSGGAGGESPGNVYQVASSLDDYSSLVAAVDKAGLADALQDETAMLTVFAPDNDAFAALLAAVGAASLDDVTAEQLRPILLYHVLGEEVDSTGATAAAESGAKVTGLGGAIQLGFEGADIELDDSAIIEVADVPASNGIIHGISGVLLPSIVDMASTTPELSSLLAAVLAADGADGTTPKVSVALDAPAAVGAYTLFAPSNDAFAALGGGAPAGQALTNVLLYHVVNGAAPIYAGDALGLAAPTAFDTLRGATAPFQIVVSASGSPPDTVNIDDAGSDANTTVIGANYFTSNGVLHIIDKVLLPGE